MCMRDGGRDRFLIGIALRGGLGWRRETSLRGTGVSMSIESCRVALRGPSSMASLLPTSCLQAGSMSQVFESLRALVRHSLTSRTVEV